MLATGSTVASFYKTPPWQDTRAHFIRSDRPQVGLTASSRHRQMRSDKGPSAQAQCTAVRAKQPRGVLSGRRLAGGLGSRGGRGGECTQEREFHSDAWYLLGGNSTLQEQWAGVCALSCLGLKRNSPSAERNSRGGIQSL